MSRFNFETEEQKARFKRRAELLKPKSIGVVATSAGWSKPQPNGTMELLVSFVGLDELLGENDPVLDDEPLVFKLDDVVEQIKQEEAVPEVVVEKSVVQPQQNAAPEKKKPGRPKER